MCRKIRCDGESWKFFNTFWKLNKALIFYACAVKFDVTENLNFFSFKDELNKAYINPTPPYDWLIDLKPDPYLVSGSSLHVHIYNAKTPREINDVLVKLIDGLSMEDVDLDDNKET